MSWWPVPDSPGDVTGDGPADAVDEALGDLARGRGGDKPGLPELLTALGGTLGRAVTTRDGVAAAPAAPPDLAAAVGRAVAGIGESFERDQGRQPRPVEVLYAFTFALGSTPELYLRQPFPKDIVLALG